MLWTRHDITSMWNWNSLDAVAWWTVQTCKCSVDVQWWNYTIAPIYTDWWLETQVWVVIAKRFNHGSIVDKLGKIHSVSTLKYGFHKINHCKRVTNIGLFFFFIQGSFGWEQQTVDRTGCTGAEGSPSIFGIPTVEVHDGSAKYRDYPGE